MKLKDNGLISKLLFFIFISLLFPSFLATSCGPHCENCDVSGSQARCLTCIAGYCLSSFDTLCYPKDSSDVNKFYSIDKTNAKCTYSDSCNYADGNHLLIVGTGECFTGNRCPEGYYRLDKRCFKGDCPENSYQEYFEGEIICKCVDKYYTDSSLGKVCYPPGQYCDASHTHLNVQEKSCSTGAPSGTFKKRKVIRGGIEITEYIQSCDADEIESSDFCTKICSNQNDFLFLEENRCSSDCKKANGDQYYKDPVTRKCVSSCSPNRGYIDYVSSTDIRYYCSESDTTCPESYPFYYQSKNVCLVDCSVTNKASVFPVQIPTYENTIFLSEDPLKTVKTCEDHCPPKKTVLNGKCVDCLSIPGNILHPTNNKCYSSCHGVLVDGEGGEYYNPYEKKCELDCNGKYLYENADKKICYNSCEESPDKKFIKYPLPDPSSSDPKICIDCPVGTGFFIYLESPKKCYQTLDDIGPSKDNYYYIKDTNELFESADGCKGLFDGENPYKFVSEDEPHKCLEKCDGLVFHGNTGVWSSANSFRTEDYICILDANPTSNFPENYDYLYNRVFYKDGCPSDKKLILKERYKGHYECIESSECHDFIEDGKCVVSCDYANDYKYRIFGSSGKPGRCFKEIEKCYDLMHYYTIKNGNYLDCVKESDCSKSNYYKIQLKPGTYYPIPREDEATCIPKGSCPSSFPFYYDGICYETSCPSFAPYHDESSIHTCVKSCKQTDMEAVGIIYPSTGKYLKGDECVSSCGEEKAIKDENKCTPDCKKMNYFLDNTGVYCIESCPNTNKYYDPVKYQCTDSVTKCKNVDIYKFTPQSSSSSNACLNICPNYYEEETLQCVSSFSGKYISSTDSKKIVTSCPDFYDGNKCVSKCNNYYYINGDNKKICSEDCSGVGFSSPYYYLSSDKQCVQSCPTKDETDKENKIDPTMTTNPRPCYKDCPKEKPYYYLPTSGTGNDVNHYQCVIATGCDTSIDSTTKYNAQGSFDCKTDCISANPRYRKITPEDKTCYLECPANQPFEEIPTENTAPINCKTDCKHRPNSKICIMCDKDDEEIRYYYSVENTCVKKCPEDMPFYKIIATPEIFLSKNYLYYTCEHTCPNYRTEQGECLSLEECLTKNLKYIGKSNICKSACDPEIDGAFYKVIVEGDPSITYNQCKDFCSEYIVDEIPAQEVRKCVSNCAGEPIYKYKSPLGYCRKSCTEEKDSPYIFSANDKNLEGDPDNFICDTECSGNINKVFEDDHICKQNCPTGKNVRLESGLCLSKCPDEKKFIDDGVCKFSCPILVSDPLDEYPVRYDSDFKCLDECGSSNKYVLPGGLCSSVLCNLNTQYPTYSFTEVKEPSKIIERKCVEKCKSDDKFTLQDKNCLEECDDDDHILLKDTNECYKGKNCKTGYVKYDNGSTKYCLRSCLDTPETDNPRYEFTRNGICINTPCNPAIEHYYESNKICISTTSNCEAGFYKEKGTAKCLNACPDKHFINENNQCVENCGEINSKIIFYVEPDRKCLDSQEKCGAGYKYLSKISIEPTPPSTAIRYNFECLKKCPYTMQYILKETQPNGKNYLICQKNCPKSFPYYFNSSDYDNQLTCVEDCSSPFIFKNRAYPICYSTIDDSNWETYYRDYGVLCQQCLETCPEYFIKDSEENIYECVFDCYGIYPFLGDNKQCLKSCPGDRLFYRKNDDENIECYTDCPSDAPIHDGKDYHQCLTEDDCFSSGTHYKFINYDNKTCIKKSQCKKRDGYHWGNYNNPEPTELSHLYVHQFCQKNCDNELFNYLFYDICVIDCTLIPNSQPDPLKKECTCNNLFYIDTTYVFNPKKVCLDNTVKECSSLSADYPYYKFENPFECVKCDGDDEAVLEGMFCIKKSQCTSDKELLTSDETKCVCKFNYYLDKNKNIVCLGENDPCPLELPLIQPKSTESYTFGKVPKGQCVASCSGIDSYPAFDTFCISSENCEDNSNYKLEVSDDLCKALYTWNWIVKKKEYTISNELNECTNELYPYLISETKECVAKCAETDYYILDFTKKPQNECVKNCPDGSAIINIPPSKTELYEISAFGCQCNKPWFYYGSSIYCDPSSTDTDCSGLPYKNMVQTTKECVEDCPADSPYLFNSKCYEDCEKPSLEYNYDLKPIEDPYSQKKECICKGLWELDGENKKCLEGEQCPDDSYKLFKHNLQCISGSGTTCDSFAGTSGEYSEFNGICYKNELCLEDNAESDGSGKCQCKKLWYYSKSSPQEKFCLNENVPQCPPHFPYQIISETTDPHNNECISSQTCLASSDQYYKYNGACYKDCTKAGTNLIQDEDNKTCKCDQSKGKWFLNYINKEKIFTCGKSSCPPEKPYLVEETNECVKSCGERSQKLFEGICYKVCPENKGAVDKKGYPYQCDLRPLSTAKNINELKQQVEEDLLLLNERHPLNGLVYSYFPEATLQIIPMNKSTNKTVLNSNNDLVKSNLSMIYLDNCIKELYSKNSLSNDTNILVVKYDVKNTKEDSIINTCEYEFYSSKNKKKLDSFACKSKGILISYPLPYNIEKKKNSTKVENKQQKIYLNNLKRFYLLSKKIHNEKKNIDPINFNDSLYTDNCLAVEVEGKDILLEERRNDFYPNVSFCEDNCIFNYTNYTEERVYCTCPLKREIKLNRKQLIDAKKFSPEDTKKKKKGPSNFHVLGCLSKNIKNDKKNAIKKNSGFYYSLFFIVGEVALGITVALYGLKIFSKKLYESVLGDEAVTLSNNNNNSDINYNKATTKENMIIESNNNNIENNENNENNEPKETKNDNRSDSILLENGQNVKSLNEVSNPPLKADKRSESPSSEEESDDEENGESKKNEQNSNRKKIEINQKEKRKEREQLPLKDIKDNDNKRMSSEVTEEKISSQEVNQEIKNEDLDEGLFEAIKRENINLRAPFEYSIKCETSSFILIVLTEIFEKNYFIRTFFLYRKFDIMSLLACLYLFYHLLCLIFSTMFFDMKIIRKIYYNNNNEKSFPDSTHYIKYGFITFIIVCVIYSLLLFLIRVDRKVNKVEEESNNNRNNRIKDSNLDKKCQEILSSLKIRIIIFFVIVLIFAIFGFIYITGFCSVYIATKKYVFIAYGVTLIIFACVKSLYGMILGILRYISLKAKIKSLFTVINYAEIFVS